MVRRVGVGGRGDQEPAGKKEVKEKKKQKRIRQRLQLAYLVSCAHKLHGVHCLLADVTLLLGVLLAGQTQQVGARTSPANGRAGRQGCDARASRPRT